MDKNALFLLDKAVDYWTS